MYKNKLASDAEKEGEREREREREREGMGHLYHFRTTAVCHNVIRPW